MEDGMTVIVTGRPEIYKPSGRFSLRAEAIELAGEGALKAAYEQLKRELDREGYFADARKRPLPRYPRRIGLVTSRIGAAIDDVLTNLEPRGYEVVFHDARVEGVLATDSLLLAMQRVADVGVDVLVLVRGGGSLESLQAFNGKDLVRAIAEFPSPVICAIGHDRDIPLAQLVADASASTPTACAFLLNAPWRDAEHEMLTARTVLRRMSQSLPNSAHDRLSLGHQIMSSAFRSIHRVVASAQHRLAISAGARMMRVFERSAGRLSSGREMLTREYLRQLTGQRARLTLSYATLVAHDPRRLLARGYAIIRGKHGVVRRISDVVEGDRVDAYLQDGRLTLGVERIQPIVHDKTHEATRGNPESFGNSFGT
jgi:exodeoxyribonuclease VII large subunit